MVSVCSSAGAAMSDQGAHCQKYEIEPTSLSNHRLSGECRLSTEDPYEISKKLTFKARRDGRSLGRKFDDTMQWVASCYPKPLWWRLGIGVAAALLGCLLYTS